MDTNFITGRHESTRVRISVDTLDFRGRIARTVEVFGLDDYVHRYSSYDFVDGEIIPSPLASLIANFMWNNGYRIRLYDYIDIPYSSSLRLNVHKALFSATPFSKCVFYSRGKEDRTVGSVPVKKALGQYATFYESLTSDRSRQPIRGSWLGDTEISLPYLSCGGELVINPINFSRLRKLFSGVLPKEVLYVGYTENALSLAALFNIFKYCLKQTERGSDRWLFCKPTFRKLDLNFYDTKLSFLDATHAGFNNNTHEGIHPKKTAAFLPLYDVPTMVPKRGKIISYDTFGGEGSSVVRNECYVPGFLFVEKDRKRIACIYMNEASGLYDGEEQFTTTKGLDYAVEKARQLVCKEMVTNCFEVVGLKDARGMIEYGDKDRDYSIAVYNHWLSYMRGVCSGLQGITRLKNLSEEVVKPVVNKCEAAVIGVLTNNLN